MIKELLGITAALVLLSSGVNGDSVRHHPGFDQAGQFKTVAGKILISVNGTPADLAAVKGASLVNLGNGAYGAVFSNIPKEARRLAVTAQVPDPGCSGRVLSQTLVTSISEGGNVEVPMDLSTN